MFLPNGSVPASVQCSWIILFAAPFLCGAYASEGSRRMPSFLHKLFTYMDEFSEALSSHMFPITKLDAHKFLLHRSCLSQVIIRDQLYFLTVIVLE